MKDLVSQPARPVPRSARRRARLRPVRAHEHRAARRAREERASRSSTCGTSRSPRTRPTATRGRRSRRGVVLSHLGPGLTNAATGVANAALDSIPMVVIAGDVPTHYFGKHPHQEINLHADAVAVRDLPAVREARVARRPAAPLPRDPRQGLHARRERPARAGAGRRADGRLLGGDRRRAVRAAASQHARAAQARRSTRRPPSEIVQQAARRRSARCSTSAAASSLADAAAELRRVRRSPRHPGRAHADGQGRAARRPSARARHDGVLGHRVHQRATPRRPTGSSRSARASREADCSSWEREYTFDIPADEAHADRHRPGRARPQLPGRDRRGRRPQAGADGAQSRRAQARCPTASSAPNWSREIAAYRATFKRGQRGTRRSDAWPMRPERILAESREVLPRDAIITTDVGWNKNGVGQQFHILTPGTLLTPGGFATMGFGAPAALGAKIAQPGPRRRLARRRRRLRAEPGGARDRVRGEHRRRLGRHEQLRVRHDRGAREGAFGTTFGTVFEKDGKPYSPGLRRDRARRTASTASRSSRRRSSSRRWSGRSRSASPVVIDVSMENVPMPTAGHWNIMDIYSPGKKVQHASVTVAAK